MTTKPTVAFVPGTMCDKRLWEPVIAILQPEYAEHYVAIESCKSRAEMLQAVSDGVNKVGSTNPNGANLIGFSMGGYLSMLYALNNPSKINKLVLISISANPLPDHEMSMRRKSIEWLKQNRYTGIARGRLQQFVHPSRMFDSRLVNTIKAMDNELGHDVLFTQITETSEREPLMEKLHQLDFPVMIIGAENDALVDVQDLEAMAEALPKSELHIIPESGHMLPLEQPQVVAELIKGFVSC